MESRPSASYAERMPLDIPDNQLERAQTRVNQLLDPLRRETGRLAPDADSALTFHPDPAE